MGIKTDQQRIATMPLKETNGILLACLSLITMARLIGDMGFKLNSIHLGVDALLQITVLLAPQQQIQRSYSKILRKYQHAPF